MSRRAAPSSAIVRIVDRISQSNSHWWGPRVLVFADPVAVEPIPVIGELGFSIGA